MGDSDAVFTSGSDQSEIFCLEAAYGPRWDTADGAGWSRLFTEDGVFAVARADGTAEVRARGRTELQNRCDLFNRDRRGVHLLQHPDLAVDGETARAVVAFAFWGSDRVGAGTLEVVGMYKVEYTNGNDGWKMRYRYEIPTLRKTAVMFARDIDDIGWLSDRTDA